MSAACEEVEPPTSGRVILHTAYGPLEVELWCHECPATCRNFLQLCLEGYYEQTVFHRLVRGFVLQGGDPTGTGGGGRACNDAYLPPEYHTRLKWTRRGLLGMAAMDEASSSGSQFFLTLADTPELYRKATLFGKLVGDTIYNLVRMGELEADGERPVDPPLILRAEVLTNPFDDIIPRELPEVYERRRRLAEREATKGSERKTERRTERRAVAPAAIRSKAALSFGKNDGEEEEEPTLIVKRGRGIRSSHEVLNDPTLSRQPVVIAAESDKPACPDKRCEAKGTHDAGDALAAIREIRSGGREDTASTKDKIAALQRELQQMSRIEPAAPTLPTSASRADSLAQLLGTKKTVPAADGSLLEAQRSAFKERKRAIVGKRTKSHADEMDTLLALNAFRDKLRATSGRADPSALPKTVAPAAALDICKLHGLVACDSCRDTFGARREEGTEEGWLMHRLVFDKDAGYREVRADLDQLRVIDPRERAQSFRKPD